ncbi:hypothetical protein [Pelagibacterium halotolerans]|uniref:hypothetical protein n=1 Tax=Pelagibacterium halotolerans TaxID=531813 RepID=UPI00384EFE9A
MSDDNDNSALRDLDWLLNRMRPLLAEFHAIIDRAFADDPAMHGWRATDFALDVETGAIRPRLTGVPEGHGVHPDHPRYWMPARRPTVELAARTLAHRSRRFDGHRVMPVDADWKDDLRAQHPGMFECEMSVGSGWADLIRAYVEMRGERGEVPRFVQIKEKFGSLRLYESGMSSGLQQIADHLSMCICEECGAPGELRAGGWVRTLCDDHAERRR